MSTISHFSEPSTFQSDFQADMADVEREIECRRVAEAAERDAEMIRLQREDEGRCRRCGDMTEGAEILGTHVHVCPACLADFVATRGWTRPAKYPEPRKFITCYV
jgi:hypothetical protein